MCALATGQSLLKVTIPEAADITKEAKLACACARLITLGIPVHICFLMT